MLCYFLQSLQHLILCIRLAREIDNLLFRWGKIFCLCRVQVPRQPLDSLVLHRAIFCYLCHLLSSSMSYWSDNLGHISMENLMLNSIIPFSWGLRTNVCFHVSPLFNLWSNVAEVSKWKFKLTVSNKHQYIKQYFGTNWWDVPMRLYGGLLDFWFWTVLGPQPKKPNY